MVLLLLSSSCRKTERSLPRRRITNWRTLSTEESIPKVSYSFIIITLVCTHFKAHLHLSKLVKTSKKNHHKGKLFLGFVIMILAKHRSFLVQLWQRCVPKAFKEVTRHKEAYTLYSTNTFFRDDSLTCNAWMGSVWSAHSFSATPAHWDQILFYCLPWMLTYILKVSRFCALSSCFLVLTRTK